MAGGYRSIPSPEQFAVCVLRLQTSLTLTTAAASRRVDGVGAPPADTVESSPSVVVDVGRGGGDDAGDGRVAGGERVAGYILGVSVWPGTSWK